AEEPRSEPDSGNPTIRDRRGAYGIVGQGSRTEARRETCRISHRTLKPSRAIVLSRHFELPVRRLCGYGSTASDRNGWRRVSRDHAAGTPGRCTGRRGPRPLAAVAGSRRRALQLASLRLGAAAQPLVAVRFHARAEPL